MRHCIFSFPCWQLHPNKHHQGAIQLRAMAQGASRSQGVSISSLLYPLGSRQACNLDFLFSPIFSLSFSPLGIHQLGKKELVLGVFDGFLIILYYCLCQSRRRHQSFVRHPKLFNRWGATSTRSLNNKNLKNVLSFFFRTQVACLLMHTSRIRWWLLFCGCCCCCFVVVVVVLWWWWLFLLY